MKYYILLYTKKKRNVDKKNVIYTNNKQFSNYKKNMYLNNARAFSSLPLSTTYSAYCVDFSYISAWQKQLSSHNQIQTQQFKTATKSSKIDGIFWNCNHVLAIICRYSLKMSRSQWSFSTELQQQKPNKKKTETFIAYILLFFPQLLRKPRAKSKIVF